MFLCREDFDLADELNTKIEHLKKGIDREKQSLADIEVSLCQVTSNAIF